MRGFEVPIQSTGAVVPVHVGISSYRWAALTRLGQVPPPPIPLHFLVDTGASCSWIDEMHMRTLGLEARSWGEVHDLSGKGIPRGFNAYDICLTIGGIATPSTRRFELPIGTGSFDNQGIDGLLGRDVLNVCHLGWRGTSRVLRIDYE